MVLPYLWMRRELSHVCTAVLHRIAKGDPTAINECLERFGGLIWTLARRMSRSFADAEDATQEIFVEIWKNAARFDSKKSSEATFVTMIARRRLIDRHRKQSRQLQPVTIDEDVLTPASRQPDRVELNDEAARAAKFLKELRPQERQVLELSIYHRMPQGQISEKLGLPLGTVKTHARRGMLRLRAMLSADDKTAAKGGAQ